MKKKTGNNQFLKELNQKSILDLIRIHKSISRAELSEETGLSATAIGMIVSNLLEAGYITETGIGESKGGRKPVMLELKPESYYSIGIDIDVNYINIMLMDITGSVISEKLQRIGDSLTFEEIMQKLECLVFNEIEENRIAIEKLLGIGISIPGMVNVETGEVLLAPNLHWENADVRKHLPKLSNVPVYIENEAMASAISENWLGWCQGVNNFISINIKSGIGAGIFVNGKLYRGAGGSAGEVGHIVVDENGPKCGCGNYGCLETMASTTRIVEKAKRLVKQGVSSKLNEIEDVDEIQIDSIVSAAQQGDETAKSILLESARYLGIAISNIVNTLNPTRIVIGKEFVKYAGLVMQQIKDIVACKALKYPASDVEINSSALGEKASVYGAAIIPLKTIFGK